VRCCFLGADLRAATLRIRPEAWPQPSSFSLAVNPACSRLLRTKCSVCVLLNLTSSCSVHVPFPVSAPLYGSGPDSVEEEPGHEGSRAACEPQRAHLAGKLLLSCRGAVTSDSLYDRPNTTPDPQSLKASLPPISVRVNLSISLALTPHKQLYSQPPTSNLEPSQTSPGPAVVPLPQHVAGAGPDDDADARNAQRRSRSGRAGINPKPYTLNLKP
jgi:hypothetical protein